MSIDCVVDVSICAEMDVMTYPTIRLHRSDGRMVRYRGPRRSTSSASLIIPPYITKIANPFVEFWPFFAEHLSLLSPRLLPPLLSPILPLRMTLHSQPSSSQVNRLSMSGNIAN